MDNNNAAQTIHEVKSRAPKSNFSLITRVMAAVRKAAEPVVAREKKAHGVTNGNITALATATAPDKVMIEVTFGVTQPPTKPAA